MNNSQRNHNQAPIGNLISFGIFNQIVDKGLQYIDPIVSSLIGDELYADQYFDYYHYKILQQWVYLKDKKRYIAHTKKAYISESEEDYTGTSCSNLEPCRYIIPLDKTTFCIICCSLLNPDKSERYYSISLLFVGEHRKRYIREVCAFVKNIKASSKKQDLWRVNKNHSSFPYYTTLDRRQFSTIFMDPDKKNDLIEYIKNWNKNSNLFESKGISYKTGILLYGEPGTGKSTVARAIADMLNCSILNIDMTSLLDIDLDQIMDYMRREMRTMKSNRLVILLEDIDCIVRKRDTKPKTIGFAPPKDSEPEDDDKKIIERKSLNILLNLIDGVNGISNVIFVATTNYYDRLDWALIRDGRFDKKIEMNLLNKEIAGDMCRSFGLNPEDVLPDDFKPIRPTELQNRIIQYVMKNPK